jgi:hypothetical protein
MTTEYDCDRDMVMRLTDRGEGMYPDGANPEHILIVEIMKRIREATQGNVLDLCDELIRKYESIENAITAVKSGTAQFEQGPELHH